MQPEFGRIGRQYHLRRIHEAQGRVVAESLGIGFVEITYVVYVLHTQVEILEKIDSACRKQLIHTALSAIAVFYVTYLGQYLGVSFVITEIITGGAVWLYPHHHRRVVEKRERYDEIIYVEQVVRCGGTTLLYDFIILVDGKVRHKRQRIPGGDGGRIQ